MEGVLSRYGYNFFIEMLGFHVTFQVENLIEVSEYFLILLEKHLCIYSVDEWP